MPHIFYRTKIKSLIGCTHHVRSSLSISTGLSHTTVSSIHQPVSLEVPWVSCALSHVLAFYILFSDSEHETLLYLLCLGHAYSSIRSQMKGHFIKKYFLTPILTKLFVFNLSFVALFFHGLWVTSES